jgi:hypothetical protein
MRLGLLLSPIELQVLFTTLRQRVEAMRAEERSGSGTVGLNARIQILHNITLRLAFIAGISISEESNQ